mmetsp:Transcript_41078/g.114172  ORF Transcript_41078/g.114172 Transcript_41078/m.114172 type:complete len:226 (+) Transcript_41078:599-1276(+)
MVGDDGVLCQLGTVLLQHCLEALQRAVLVCRGDGSHGIDRRTRVLEAALAADDSPGLLWPADHDLREQHVLHCCPRLLLAVSRVVGLKGLIEVGVGCAEVLLPRADDTRPHIDVCLQEGGAMDGVGVGFGRGQLGLGFWDVLHSIVCPTRNEVYLHEQELVIELLHLCQQLCQQLQGLLVFRFLQVEPRKPRFHPLPQECALLALTPFDTIRTHLNLQRPGVRRL